MSPLALGLLLVAAVLHAGWNVMVKQAKQKQVFLWWGLITGSLCFSVFFLVEPAIPQRAWPYVISSALMEALYFIALTWAYTIDDFSLVYPIARGAAPILLTVWVTLFLGTPPSLAGLLGIILLTVGLVVVGSASLWSRSARTHFSASGIIAALATALCISIYTTIDGAAVRFTPPLPYTILVLGLSTLIVAPILFFRYGGRIMLAEWRLNWWRILCVGIATLAGYALILQAYALAKVSYAGSVREVSVIFAALLGWRFLGERFGLPRTIGAVLIFLGIVIIAVLG